MSEGQFVGLGPCGACGTAFQFDPARVTTVSIDPQTSLPPDVNEDGTNKTPDPGAVERSIKMPLCPSCIDRGNRVRAAKGLPLIPHESENPPIF